MLREVVHSETRAPFTLMYFSKRARYISLNSDIFSGSFTVQVFMDRLATCIVNSFISTFAWLIFPHASLTWNIFNYCFAKSKSCWVCIRIVSGSYFESCTPQVAVPKTFVPLPTPGFRRWKLAQQLSCFVSKKNINGISLQFIESYYFNRALIYISSVTKII